MVASSSSSSSPSSEYSGSTVAPLFFFTGLLFLFLSARDVDSLLLLDNFPFFDFLGDGNTSSSSSSYSSSLNSLLLISFLLFFIGDDSRLLFPFFTGDCDWLFLVFVGESLKLPFFFLGDLTSTTDSSSWSEFSFLLFLSDLLIFSFAAFFTGDFDLLLFFIGDSPPRNFDLWVFVSSSLPSDLWTSDSFLDFLTGDFLARDFDLVGESSLFDPLDLTFIFLSLCSGSLSSSISVTLLGLDGFFVGFDNFEGEDDLCFWLLLFERLGSSSSLSELFSVLLLRNEFSLLLV